MGKKQAIRTLLFQFYFISGVCGKRGRGNRGLTARLIPAVPRPVGFLAETFPRAASRPAGKSPVRFSPHPFCGVREKIYLMGAFLHSRRPAFSCRRRVAAPTSLAALLLGGTRLFLPEPPRRLGESLARPLRARRRPPRTDRVWAADAMGCYDRSRVPVFADIQHPRRAQAVILPLPGAYGEIEPTTFQYG